MFAIYIVTLLALMGSEIVPSRVQSHSSDDDDNNSCNIVGQAVVNKIKHLQGMKDLPECTIGAIAKVDIFNANSGITTTVLICAGCNGPLVPITSSTECKNVPDVFRPLLDELCQIVLHPRCKSITVYRCGSPVEFTTKEVTTSVETTVSPTPPVTTTQPPPPPTTTILRPSTTIYMTPTPPEPTTQPPPPPTTTIYMTPTPPEPTTQPPPPPTTTIPRPTTTIYMTPHLNPDVTIPW